MKHVMQKHKRGCSLASLAMLTGIDYDEILAYFPIDFNEQGIYEQCLDNYLVDHGFALSRKHKYPKFGKQREPWPPLPFADMHLCNVKVNQDSPVTHFVIMLGNGDCFDPLTTDIKHLSDYFEVNNVAGIHKIGANHA